MHTGYTRDRHEAMGEEVIQVDFSLMVANDIERMRVEEAARKAPWVWRFRQVKGREHKIVSAILASIVAFFLR